MTDVQLLINLIERDPDSDITAAMLTDELMECRGMLRSEADRHVERVRADARTALQIQFTAGLIAAKGPAYYAMRNEVARVLGFNGNETYSFVVVGGEDEPRVSVAGTMQARALGVDGLFVALPAGWVCAWFRRNTFPVRAPYSRKGK